MRRLPIALVLVLTVILLTSCRGLNNPPPPPTLPPVQSPEPPAGKPLIVPGVPGLYVAWSTAGNAIPPTREPGDPLAPGNEMVGVDCISYLGSGGDVGATGVWDARSAINWSPYDYCLKQAAAAKVKLADGQVVPQPVILTVPSGYSDTGSRWYNTTGHGEPGSAGNPFIRLHLPPWMQNDAYRFSFTVPASGNVYQSIRYGGEFKKRMIEFIQAAGQRYNSNPQVAAVRVYVGVQGESQPVVQCQPYWDAVPPAGRDNLDCGSDTQKSVMTEHEKTVSCNEYMIYVRDLTEAAVRAFPDKAVLSMVDSSPCTTMSGKAFRKWLYEEQWAGKPIGVSMNNINVDRPDVDERPGNALTTWNKWTVGRALRDLGYPMLYEFDAHTPSVEGMYWTVLSGAGNGGNFVLYHSPWKGSFSQPMWQVVDYWLGSERRAWLVFRDREYPTYDFTPGYGTSGSIGDWGKYLRAVNADEAPQVCAPSLAKSARSANATATAGGALSLTPACPESLPTPIITPAATPSPGPDTLNRLYNRQARRLDAGKTLRVAVSGDWPAFGLSAPLETTVSYLDIGTDSFDVVLPGANGRPARHTIRKGDTRIWQEVTWVENVAIGNVLDGDNFLQIINDGAGPEYLHQVYVTVPEKRVSADRDADAGAHCNEHGSAAVGHSDAGTHADTGSHRDPNGDSDGRSDPGCHSNADAHGRAHFNFRASGFRDPHGRAGRFRNPACDREPHRCGDGDCCSHACGHLHPGCARDLDGHRYPGAHPYRNAGSGDCHRSPDRDAFVYARPCAGVGLRAPAAGLAGAERASCPRRGARRVLRRALRVERSRPVHRRHPSPYMAAGVGSRPHERAGRLG